MAESKYGKYLTRPAIQTRTLEVKYYIDKKLIREEKKYIQDLTYTGKEATGGSFALYWYAIKEPFVMYEPPHSHDHDQYEVFLGGDSMDVGEFDAEVDIWLGEEAEKHTIDFTSIVHIPKGLVHRQIDFKRVDKPIMLINLFLSPEYKKAQIFDE